MCESVGRLKLYSGLAIISEDNSGYFESSRWCKYGNQISELCHFVVAELPKCYSYSKVLLQDATKYDFHPKQPANGLRSLVKITDSCVQRLLEIQVTVKQKRYSLLFRSGPFYRELKCFVDVLLCLSKYQECLVDFYDTQDAHSHCSLFVEYPLNDTVMIMQEKLLLVDTTCFYGLGCGFQVITIKEI